MTLEFPRGMVGGDLAEGFRKSGTDGGWEVAFEVANSDHTTVVK